jgi:hypothetical protein
MPESVSTIVAVIGAVTGIAALIIQWRKQNFDSKLTEASLLLDAHTRAEKEKDVTTDQLSRISSLSVGLLEPLQNQINVLSGRMTIMEGQIQRYRRWIVELMLITQHYSGQLDEARLHEMVFNEIFSDATITELLESIEKPKDGESLDAPGLSSTGRLRVLKPR